MNRKHTILATYGLSYGLNISQHSNNSDIAQSTASAGCVSQSRFMVIDGIMAPYLVMETTSSSGLISRPFRQYTMVLPDFAVPENVQVQLTCDLTFGHRTMSTCRLWLAQRRSTKITWFEHNR